MQVLTSMQWNQIREWVESETGMDLGGNRLRRLQDAVAKVLGRQEMEAVVPLLLTRAEGCRQFLEQLTVELTVGESYFLRNATHFCALKEHVLPRILRDNASRREVRVWSAGCAAGEEPYSVAILLDQLLPEPPSWRVMILGSDLNSDYLSKARAACYRQWSFRQTEIHHDPRYFTAEDGGYRLRDRLRDWVRFTYLNLVKDVYPSLLSGTVGLDLILFRNVAIYLRPEVTSAILERFWRTLRPGGWLLLGETEVNLAPQTGFEVLRFGQATFFQKPSNTSARDQSPLPAVPVLSEIWNRNKAPPARTPEISEWVSLPRAERRDSSVIAVPPTSARSRDPGMASVWHRVEHCLREKDVRAAERIVDRILNPRERAAVRLRLSRCLLSTAEMDAARQQVALCLKDDPMLLEGQLLQASLLEESGEMEKAEQACRRALYLDRNCAIAHFHLALLCRRKGDMPGSERSLRTTLRLAAAKDPHEIVEYGDGLCYGRLRELVLLLTGVGTWQIPGRTPQPYGDVSASG